MSAINTIKQRRSIRAYLDTPVDQAVVEELLDIARWSPSGGNLQPWKVIAVTGEAKAAVTQLAQGVLFTNPKGEEDEVPMYPANMPEPYRSRRYQAGESLYDKLGIPREDKASRFNQVAQNFAFFGAPVGLFFVISRAMGKGQWAHLGMFMQSLALAAESKGLGTCMQEAWAMVRKSLHGHFGLDEDEILYCGMALGWPDAQAPINCAARARAETNTFARFEGFGS
jgi:nitroreductase